MPYSTRQGEPRLLAGFSRASWVSAAPSFVRDRPVAFELYVRFKQRYCLL